MSVNMYKDGKVIKVASGGTQKMDSIPTNGSRNAVTSEGIFNAIKEKDIALMFMGFVANGTTVNEDGTITATSEIGTMVTTKEDEGIKQVLTLTNGDKYVKTTTLTDTGVSVSMIKI